MENTRLIQSLSVYSRYIFRTKLSLTLVTCEMFPNCAAGVYPPPRAPSSWWRVRPFARRPGQDVQHREDGVPQVSLPYGAQCRNVLHRVRSHCKFVKRVRLVHVGNDGSHALKIIERVCDEVPPPAAVSPLHPLTLLCGADSCRLVFVYPGATLGFPLALRTAARRSADTPTSSAPRRS